MVEKDGDQSATYSHYKESLLQSLIWEGQLQRNSQYAGTSEHFYNQFFTSVLHTKLAPGWALIRENLDPIQKCTGQKVELCSMYMCMEYDISLTFVPRAHKDGWLE